MDIERLIKKFTRFSIMKSVLTFKVARREQLDKTSLWEVIAGPRMITTEDTEEEAQEVSNELNNALKEFFRDEETFLKELMKKEIETDDAV